MSLQDSLVEDVPAGETPGTSRLGPLTPYVPAALLVLGWIYLNWLMNVRMFTDESWVVAALLPSIDVVVALAIPALLAFAGKTPGVVWVPVTAVLVVSRIAFVADEATLHLLGRSFSLYPDYTLIWELLLIAEERVHMTTIMMYVAGFALAFGAAAFLVKQVLLAASNVFQSSRVRAGYLGAALLLGGGSVALGASESLVADLVSQLWSLTERSASLREFEARVSAAAKNEVAPMEGLRGRHVAVVFVESYGGAALADSEVSSVLSGADTELAEAGWHVRSARLHAPRVSAVSELAWVSVLTGVAVSNPAERDAMLGLSVHSLAHRFSQTGHRTILVLPGHTRQAQSDVGEFYGFGLTYYSWRLGYQGPTFGASPMPDQFVLDRVHRIELTSPDAPVFALFMLTSSQAPFDEEPVLHADWTEVADGAVFEGDPKVVHDVDLSRLRSSGVAWRSTLRYSLRTTVAWMANGPVARRAGGRRGIRRGRPAARRSVRANPLVIVLGDHAPLSPAAEHPVATVPVHVLCRDAEVLRSVAGQGWSESMLPPDEPPVAASHELHDIIVEAWGRADAE